MNDKRLKQNLGAEIIAVLETVTSSVRVIYKYLYLKEKLFDAYLFFNLTDRCMYSIVSAQFFFNFYSEQPLYYYVHFICFTCLLYLSFVLTANSRLHKHVFTLQQFLFLKFVFMHVYFILLMSFGIQ